MITNTANLNLITQVAKLYCLTDVVCQSSIYERLKNFLDDALFSSVLSRLNQGRSYYQKITRMQIQNNQKATLYFSFTDLITGDFGTGEVRDIPLTKLNDLNYICSKVGLIYLGKIQLSDSIYFIVNNPNVPGYGISYNPNNPPVGGGGQSGDDDTRGGGNFTVDPPTNYDINPVNTIQPAQSNASGFLSGLNFNDLIIPGGILLAIYLVVKK